MPAYRQASALTTFNALAIAAALVAVPSFAQAQAALGPQIAYHNDLEFLSPVSAVEARSPRSAEAALHEQLALSSQRVLRGALIGAGVGLVAGFVLRAGDDSNCLVPGECVQASRISATTAYVVLPLAGAAVGSVVGVAVNRDRSLSIAFRWPAAAGRSR